MVSLAWVLSSIALAIMATFLWLDLRRQSNDTFQVFYYAAKTLANGGDIYRSHVPGSQECEYVYPPLFAMIIEPLTHLKPLVATRIWTLADAVLTLFALLLGSVEACRRFQVQGGKAAVIVIAAGALLLGMGELKTELGTSQTDTLVLVSYLLGLVWLDKRPMLSGIALGFGCNIKYQTFIALPYLLWTRRWKAAASAVLSSLVFAFLPAAVVGLPRNIQYLRSTLGGLGRFAGTEGAYAASTVPLTWIRSVSITSAIGRLLERCGIASSHALPLGALAGIACVAGIYVMYKRHRFPMAPVAGALPGKAGDGLAAIEWTGLLVAWLLFGPEVSRRHMYVLLLLHTLAMVFLISGNPRRRLILIGGLVICQIGLRMPSGGPFESLSRAFNWAGGASWCVLACYLTVLATFFARMPNEGTATPALTMRWRIWKRDSLRRVPVQSGLAGPGRAANRTSREVPARA